MFFDVNPYRGVIETQMAERLQRKVTLGRMAIGLLPLRFRVADAVIADDPLFQNPQPFVRADSVEVRVSLAQLFRGNVEILSVEMKRPAVELVRNKQGVWNFASLGPPPNKESADAADSASPASVALNLLTIADGQIAITDHQYGGARTVYDHIDFMLRDYKAGQPFKTELSAHLPGGGTSEIRLAGEGGPIPAAGPASTPFNGALTIREVEVAGLQAFLGGAALEGTAGSLSGETRIRSQSGELGADGNLALSGLRLNGLDVGYPIALDYDLASKTETGILAIRKANLLLGKTPLAVAGSIDASKTPVILELGVKSGEVSIGEIARLASAFGLAFAPDATVSGNVAVDVQARGPIDNPALQGLVSGRDIAVALKDVPEPVRVSALNVSLTPDRIQTNEFTAVSGKTALNGRFAVSQYRSATPLIDAAIQAPSAELSEIQAIAGAYGLTGLDQLRGAGALKLDLHAVGPAKTLDAASIMKAVNGKIDLDFSPLQIKGFDVVKELAAIGKFSAAGEHANLTDLLKLTGTIAVKNGVAETSDLRAQFASGSLSAVGAADLAESNLDMRLSAVFSKAVSDKVGGTKVGGYLTSALTNSSGELVVPAIVTGAFSQPKFAPDLKAVVELQKQKYLPTLSDPRSAVSGILGAFTAPKTETPKADTPPEGAAPPPASSKAEEAVKGILGGLFGRKPEAK
jgi:hypothetical protein